MTRILLYVVCCAMVLVTGYWAYEENYETQDAQRRVETLKKEIEQQREAIRVLQAEWAFLNRPSRLRALVEMNFNDLELLEILPQHYADVEFVAFPQIEVPQLDLNNPVSVSEQEDQN